MLTGACPSCADPIALTTASSTLLTCARCRHSFLAAGASEVPLVTRSDLGTHRVIARFALSPEFRARYQLGRVLGTGAAGMVFQAKEVDTGRLVAIKFLTQIGEPQMLHRFLQEAELLDRLEHPNVLRVFELDELEGHPYLAMECLEGGTLRDRLEERGRLPLEEALAVMQDGLAGLLACHQHHIVHRDLKPENILFTAAGVAKIADLGIAKVHDDREKVTQTGALMGTPRYMSPEQVKGQPAGVPADIYAMGAVFYEMLTGRPPFVADNVYVLLRMHVETAPAPLCESVPGVPPRLAELVHRALSKDPLARPASAESFLRELSDIGGPVPVRRPSSARPAPDLSGLESGSSVSTRDEVSAWTFSRMRGRGRPASAAAATLDPVRRRNARRIAAAVAVAVVSLASLALVYRPVARQPEDPVLSPPTAPALDRLGDVLPAGAVVRLGTLRFRHPSVRCLAGSADGRLMASGGEDGHVRVWSAASGEPLLDLDLEASLIPSVALSADGKLLASGAGDSAVRLHDTSNGALVRKLTGHTGKVHAVALTPDARLLVSGSEDRTLRVWEVATGRALAVLGEQQAPVFTVSTSPDGRLVASGAGDRHVRIHDLASRRLLQRLGPLEAGPIHVEFSPDGKLLATSSGPALRLWNVATGVALREPVTHEKGVTCIAFSRDGSRVASAGRDHALVIRDTARGTELSRWRTTGDRLRDLLFSRDGTVLTAAGSDHCLRRWNVASGVEAFPGDGHPLAVGAIAFAPDGRSLVSGGEDGSARLWDALAGRQLARLPGSDRPVFAVAISPDGTRAATGGKDAKIRVSALPAGLLTSELGGHTESVRSLAFAPDGKRLASGSGDNSIRLWQVAAGPDWTSTPLFGSTGDVQSLAFTPGGERLLAGTRSMELRLWSLTSGQDFERLTGHEASVVSVACSADGRVAASADLEGRIRIWDLPKRQPVHILSGRQAMAAGVALSPDGALLATGGRDAEVHVWSTATGRHLHAFRGHAGPLRAIAFSPDGRRVASASEDTTVLIWELNRGPGAAR